MESDDFEKQLGTVRGMYEQYLSFMSGRVAGYPALLGRLFMAFLSGGNVLLEGAPGLGKTTLARAWAEYFGFSFSRVQFTPDLMPLDILGSNMLQDGPAGRQFQFYKGPIFANVVLGDEINRATPKTQSAFLEAMEEHHVTILGQTYPLPEPFFVIATQNPVELEGTYPLPEAQVDRFFMKLRFSMPDAHALMTILDMHDRQDGRARPIATAPGHSPSAASAASTVSTDAPPASAAEASGVLDAWERLRQLIAVPASVRTYIVRLVQATHPDRSDAPLVRKAVLYGASPRTALSLLAAGRASAAMAGRPAVSFDDIDAVLYDVAAHRLVVSLDAEADGITATDILDAVRETTAPEFGRDRAAGNTRAVR